VTARRVVSVEQPNTYDQVTDGWHGAHAAMLRGTDGSFLRLPL